VAVALLAQGVGLGCASTPKPRKSCLSFDASEELNFYDGVPHPVTVYVYALSTPEGFEGALPDDLLVGTKPAGALQPPVPITVQPGEHHSVQQLFPADTHQLGLLADFYRAPGDPLGTLTQVVPARCGLRRPKLLLSRSDIYPKP
jgi:type VI secretion system VasD/TssJ family lipoprotein